MSKRRHVTYESTYTDRVITEDGTIKEESQHHESEGYQEVEPKYFKIYIDTLLSFSGLPKYCNGVFMSLCSYMSYAENNQIVFVNKYTKEHISQENGLTIKRVEQIIRELCKHGIMVKVQRGVYKINPYVAAKGEWKNIRKLRATFDYLEGSVSVDVETQESEDSSTSMPNIDIDELGA